MRTFTVRVRPHSLTWRSELPVGLKKQNNTKQNKMKQQKKKWKKNEKQQQQLVFHHVIATSLNCNLFSDELQPRENYQQKQEKY